VTDREVLRLAPPVIFWWVWVAFVTVNLADYAVQGLPSARFGAVVAAILLLVTGLVYTLALRPRVIADGDGLTVVNPYRVHRVPWPLIDSVDAGEWVQVRPAAGKTVYCWALYVSARARRKTGRAAAGTAAGRPSRGAWGVRDLWAAPDRNAGRGADRLPEEARYLASLPPATAMAVRLDTRAEKARKRAGVAGAGAGAEGGAGGATSAWSWPALAAVAVPALILLAVVLA